MCWWSEMRVGDPGLETWGRRVGLPSRGQAWARVSWLRGSGQGAWQKQSWEGTGGEPRVSPRKEGPQSDVR